MEANSICGLFLGRAPHADGAAEESELPRLLGESEMRTEEKLRQPGRVCLLNAALGAEPGDCLFK